MISLPVLLIIILLLVLCLGGWSYWNAPPGAPAPGWVTYRGPGVSAVTIILVILIVLLLLGRL